MNSVIIRKAKEKIRETASGMQKLFVILAIACVFAALSISPVFAGTYLNSAHGNSSYGVKRSASGFPTDYPDGHCAHCHELHASHDGFEPAPISGSPSNYALFYNTFVSQTDGFCFQCHTDVSSYQTGGSLVNRSYSYRAGGWTADSVNDILEAFSFSSPGTSHNLDDISTFLSTNPGASTWEYTSDSNPCGACHNPHAAKGDPANSPNTAKSSGTRGWSPVSRPSQHDADDNNAWELWGDGSGEKMSDKAPSSYQAPYRYSGAPNYYEPDGSTTTDGSNLTDFVTLCKDCHDSSNTISSTTLGRDLYKIDWTNGDMHGGSAARDSTYNKGVLKLPYDDVSSTNYVLSCLDCHEPHGSPNAFLLRAEVNGVVISNPISASDNSNGAWAEFCGACHDITATDNGGPCGENTYHGAPPAWPAKACYDCHKHNAYICTGGNWSF